MSDARGLSQLLLTTWLSPSFPVGAFAYSHGVEWAVDNGDIVDGNDLCAWIEDLIEHGSIRTDAALLAIAWSTTSLDDWGGVNELALALAPSRERALETGTQGTAFLIAVDTAWPAPQLTAIRERLGTDDAAYPVAVGAAASAHAIPLTATLEAFILAAVGNLTSAALRLSLIGQSDAQAVIARTMPSIARLATWATDADVDALGSCAWRSDIATMRHETQYSRLFRS